MSTKSLRSFRPDVDLEELSDRAADLLEQSCELTGAEVERARRRLEDFLNGFRIGAGTVRHCCTVLERAAYRAESEAVGA